MGTRSKGVKKVETDSKILLSGAQWQDKRQQAQAEVQEMPIDHKGDLFFFLLWQLSNTGIRLFRELVEFPSLKVFKTGQITYLRNLL